MYLTAIGKPETPDTVNEKVKAVNGFVNGGNLVWSAPEKVWGIKCIYQSPYYDGPVTSQGIAKMKAFLDEKRPLVCHVDFDPNDPDDDMHWVLITDYKDNNFYCNDPWTGQYVNVDVYGGSVQRAVIEFRVYNPIVSQESSDSTETELDKCRIARDSHWNLLTAIAQKLDVSISETIILAEIDKLLTYEQKALQLEKEKSEMTQKATDLQKEVEETKVSLQEALDHNAVLTQELQKDQQMITSLTSKVESLSKSLQNLKDQSTKPVTQSWFEKVLEKVLDFLRR